MLTSACDFAPNDPECIGEIAENGPTWIEKTVFVNSQVGPPSGDNSEDPTEGWVSANLSVLEGKKIGFAVTQHVNLCREGVEYVFSPGGNTVDDKNQIVVPYGSNWAGHNVYSNALQVLAGSAFTGGDSVDVRWQQFSGNNGWYDTGIRLSGEAPVSFSVTGSYKSYFDLVGIYPNYGWSKRANRESGNKTLRPHTSSGSSGSGTTVIDDISNDLAKQVKLASWTVVNIAQISGMYRYNITEAQYNTYGEKPDDEQKAEYLMEVINELYAQTEAGQIEEELETLLSKTDPTQEDLDRITQLKADYALANGETPTSDGSTAGLEELEAAGGRGLFVYIGRNAPSRTWFGGSSTVDHSSQDGPRDDFFELYSHENGTSGYYGLPPKSDNPFSQNKVFIRYAEDYFNRPGNVAHTYSCPSPHLQGLIANDKCTWFFGRPTPSRRSPSGAPWVWRSDASAGLDSYTNNRGGYTLRVAYNCVGAQGRYLDAKIVKPNGESVYFGSDIGQYSYFEHNLLSTPHSRWGDVRNETNANVPTAPATGSLYFRVIDEDGNGDGDDQYDNNQGAYQITVGTYILPNDVGYVSQLIYKLIIKPIRQVFFGTDYEKGAAQKMFEKITGASAFSPAILVNIIRAMILLYITLYAIQFIFGFIQDTRTDFFFRLLRVAIILQLIHPTSWEFFSTYLLNVFIDGSLDLIRAFTSQFSSASVIGSSGAQELQENTDDPFAFFNITFNLIGNGFFWKKMGAMFVSPFDGWVYLIFIFLCLWWFFMGVVYAVYIYLVCLIAVAFLLALAPIFITMALFERTRTSFSNWLRQLTNYTMQPVMMLIALAIFNLFIYAVFYRIASVPICKTCILSLPTQDKIPFLSDFCLLTHHTLWFGAPLDAESNASLALTFFTVVVFITIASCMIQISKNATSLAASIFGGTPTGAVSGKEAGLAKENFYKAPINLALAKSNQGMSRALGKRAGTALGFNRRAEKYQKRFDKAASMVTSNPGSKIAGKSGKRAKQFGSRMASLGPVGTMLSPVAAAVGFAVGFAEQSTIETAKLVKTAATDSIFERGAVDNMQNIHEKNTGKSKGSGHASTERKEEVENTGRADDD